MLIVGAAMFGLVLNALRPSASPAAIMPSYVASWLTTELAPHNLMIAVGAAIGLSAAGGLDGWKGWLGLGLIVASAAMLAGMILESHAARRVLEQALATGLGPDYGDRIVEPRTPTYDLRVPRRQLILPFLMRHPDVQRTRNRSYGPHGKRNLLDVYRHRKPAMNAPILFQIHGGAWTYGNKNQGKPLMLHFASRGWVCFAANYRLAPKATWPDLIVDVKRAIAWIREHAQEFGADPSFILVAGGSAGGHLAALAALTPNDPVYQPGFEESDTTVHAAAPFYGAYDFTNAAEHRTQEMTKKFFAKKVIKKDFGANRKDFELASPLYRISAVAPPFFVIHGSRDTMLPVEQARLFVQRLRETSRAPVCYAELPATQHGFDLFSSIRTAHATRAVERFADYAYCWQREQGVTSRGSKRRGRASV